MFKVRNGTVTHYSSMYQGFVNRFGSPSEWPYPLFIAGCTTRTYALFNSTILTYVSGLAELITAGGVGISGPAFYRRSDSTWVGISNSGVTSDETSPVRSTDVERVVYPIGEAAVSSTDIDADDLITLAPVTDGLLWSQIAPTDGVPGTATKTLHPTPNTGGALRRLYPLTIQFSKDGPPVERDIFGELDGVFWVSAADITTPLTSEDYVAVGTSRYRVFKSGNRALDYTYFAVEER
jgi:hypothetical protein